MRGFSIFQLEIRHTSTSAKARERRSMSEKHQKLLRLADVRNRVPYSRSTIYQKISRGEFPKPISIGERAVAWLEADIDAWIEARVESARGEGRA
jgi:prophage regulatory protein